jgi:hypothetical protein
MIYFISGHRDLTQEEFNLHYLPIINSVLEDDDTPEFVIGDWEGCDTFALEYLVTLHNIPWITIYCVGEPRVKPHGSIATDFEEVYTKVLNSYDECDAAMTKDSIFDIAWIRPGREDSHTAKNIKRRYESNIS